MMKAKRVQLKILMSFLMFAFQTIGFAGIKTELIPKPNPPESGDNTFEIKVLDDGGKPIEDAKISFLIFMPAMGTMPRMEEKAKITPKGAGLYEASFDIPMGGTWELVLNVEKGEMKETSHHTLTTGIPGISSKSNGSSKNVASGEELDNLLDIGPMRLQKIGVRFAEAKTIALQRNIEAVGVVEQDQTHREELTLRFAGYVVKQFRGRVGDLVKAGEPLFSIYSPDLVTAQSELFLAEKLSSGTHSLHQAGGERLKNLGLSAGDIAQIRKEGKPRRDIVIRAPISGTILEINAREGAAVSSGQVVYIIGDLRKSFIVARVFQQDIPDLKLGQPAAVNVPGLGRIITPGTINLIYPQIEQGAGTSNVRVELSGYASGLRPGVYVDLKFPVQLGSLLAIPVEAVLYSGKHRYVFVDHGQGVLEPREIEVGKTAADLVEVRAGLKEGDRVAASGTFLLGSEAQLRSALPKWKDNRLSETKDSSLHSVEKSGIQPAGEFK